MSLGVCVFSVPEKMSPWVHLDGALFDHCEKCMCVSVVWITFWSHLNIWANKKNGSHSGLHLCRCYSCVDWLICRSISITPSKESNRRKIMLLHTRILSLFTPHIRNSPAKWSFTNQPIRRCVCYWRFCDQKTCQHKNIRNNLNKPTCICLLNALRLWTPEPHLSQFSLTSFNFFWCQHWIAFIFVFDDKRSIKPNFQPLPFAISIYFFFFLLFFLVLCQYAKRENAHKMAVYFARG